MCPIWANKTSSFICSLLEKDENRRSTQNSTAVLLLNSCIWSEVESDTQSKAFIPRLDATYILAENSDQSLLCN